MVLAFSAKNGAFATLMVSTMGLRAGVSVWLSLYAADVLAEWHNPTAIEARCANRRGKCSDIWRYQTQAKVAPMMLTSARSQW